MFIINSWLSASFSSTLYTSSVPCASHLMAGRRYMVHEKSNIFWLGCEHLLRHLFQHPFNHLNINNYFSMSRYHSRQVASHVSVVLDETTFRDPNILIRLGTCWSRGLGLPSWAEMKQVLRNPGYMPVFTCKVCDIQVVAVIFVQMLEYKQLKSFFLSSNNFDK